MSPETFATRFKEAREKKNITIKALQPLVGASPSAMNGYATGKTLPPLDVASKIAKELGVSLDWLCGNKEREDTDIAIRTCADVAAVLDEIVSKFDNATIDFYADDNYTDYGGNTIYYTSVKIESKALYHYYRQMESTMEYLKNLPANMRNDFIPYKEAMEKQLRKQMVDLPPSQSGMRFLAVEVDELPF